MWEVWSVAYEGGVVDFADEDSEESCGLFIRIGLELGGDEGPCTSGLLVWGNAI